MASLNTSPTRYEDRPKLAKIERIFAWVTGVICLIAGLIYAGVRGHYAYVHTPAVQINFQQSGSINFPAVTFCQLYDENNMPPIQLIECVRETSFQEDTDCRSTAYFRSFIIEGETHNCITVNDPQNSGTAPIFSTSTNDEMGIILQINSSLIPPGEPVGALAMIHQQGQYPSISVANAFLVDVGKLTDVWIREDVYFPINGSNPSYIWSGVQSTATIQQVNPNATLNTMDLDFVFAAQGTYSDVEYYVYGRDNWIGEVGGFCALLLFLHAAVNFIAMLILERVIKDSRGQRLTERQSETIQ